MILRWLRFSTVGAIGIAVQLGALAMLKGALGLDYLLATALAVEIAVLHNFVWHERWTWVERMGAEGVIGRLLRFHLGNGVISIAGNLIFMRLLVGRYHLPYLAANLLAIAAGSLANFLVSELFVFRPARVSGTFCHPGE